MIKWGYYALYTNGTKGLIMTDLDSKDYAVHRINMRRADVLDKKVLDYGCFSYTLGELITTLNELGITR